jgi:uncharacterized membrane protein YheB (UPF0754 family)
VVVAQLVRASDCGSEGRRFEPGQPPQIDPILPVQDGFLFTFLNMNYWLIAIPFVGALLAWIANGLAIQFLFRPYTPKKILGIPVHGILPGRQKQLAQLIGREVQKEFVSYNEIEKKISDPANLEKILPLIETHVDDFLRVKLSKQMPVISMFIGDKTITTLKNVFMEEIKILFPQVMGQFASNLKTELDLEQLVTQKLMSVSPEKIEEAASSALTREFRLFKLYGAVTGFIIGLVQVLITVLTA